MTSVTTRDDLDDRMKAYEHEHRAVLPRRTHTVIRVDGKAFHSYTRGLGRPFDQQFGEDMAAVTVALCQQIAGAVCGYTQSDEISIVTCDYAGSHTEPWMGGVLPKVVSLSAAIATAEFNARRPGRLALFDSRAFTIDNPVEVVNYLHWRQSDARRNALSMICDHHLGKKTTKGRGTAWRREALAEAGVDPDSYPAVFLHGRLTVPETVVADVEYVDRRTGDTMVAEGVERRVWTIGAAPDLRDPAVLLGLLPPYAVRRAPHEQRGLTRHVTGVG